MSTLTPKESQDKDERNWLIMQSIIVLFILGIYLVFAYNVSLKNTAAEKVTTISKLQKEVNVYGYQVEDPSVLPALAQSCLESETSTVHVVGQSQEFTAHSLLVKCFRSDHQVLTIQLSPMPS